MEQLVSRNGGPEATMARLQHQDGGYRNVQEGCEVFILMKSMQHLKQMQ